MEIVDCHYCDYACTDSPDAPIVYCYVESDGYFDHVVRDPIDEAENCEWFRCCDIFPKW